MSNVVLYEKKGHIVYITINRPEKMNAVSAEVAKGLSQAWVEFRDDRDAWTAILSGAGEKAFCAGGDLRENLARARGEMVVERPPRPGVRPTEPYSAFVWTHQLWKPVIAAVNGYAMGGGFSLALACDIRVAAENAQFGSSEVRWSHMAGGQAYILPRAIPLGWAFWFCYTGQTIDARTAYQVGIVQELVPQGQAVEAATRLAESINANGPLVAQHTKEYIYRSLELPFSSAHFLEGMFYDHLRRSPDYDEGTAAFVEKRRPQYTTQPE